MEEEDKVTNKNEVRQTTGNPTEPPNQYAAIAPESDSDESFQEALEAIETANVTRNLFSVSNRQEDQTAIQEEISEITTNAKQQEGDMPVGTAQGPRDH